MTENEIILTDSEIIKALECHKTKSLLDCEICPLYETKIGFRNCQRYLDEAVLDLINHQKAEIERLNHIRAELSKEIDIWKDIAKRETGYVGIARAEAIREFVERLFERVVVKTLVASQKIIRTDSLKQPVGMTRKSPTL